MLITSVPLLQDVTLDFKEELTFVTYLTYLTHLTYLTYLIITGCHIRFEERVNLCNIVDCLRNDQPHGLIG